jgi:hypothetical protein
LVGFYSKKPWEGRLQRAIQLWGYAAEATLLQEGLPVEGAFEKLKRWKLTSGAALQTVQESLMAECSLVGLELLRE